MLNFSSIKILVIEIRKDPNKLSSKIKSPIAWNLIKVQRVPDDFMFHENENYRASHIL